MSFLTAKKEAMDKNEFLENEAAEADDEPVNVDIPDEDRERQIPFDEKKKENDN